MRIFHRLCFLVLFSISAAVPPIIEYEDPFPTTKIIDLPPGHFPDPECKYTVHVKDRDGPTVSGYGFFATEIQMESYTNSIWIHVI